MSDKTRKYIDCEPQRRNSMFVEPYGDIIIIAMANNGTLHTPTMTCSVELSKHNAKELRDALDALIADEATE